MNRLILLTHVSIAKLACDVWFDYVPSASNIADLPTRLDDSAFQRLSALGRQVPMHLPPKWCLSCEYDRLRALFLHGF